MTKDRLKELKMQQTANSSDIQLTMNQSTPTEIDNFLRESEDLERNIDIIKSIVDEIEILHEKILVSSTSENSLRDELNERMKEIKSNSVKIKENLKVMSGIILREEKDSARGSVELKIKKTRAAFLSKKFSDIMRQYNLIQANYRDDCKKRIQRQLEITGREADDEEIEEMIESNNPQIFTQGIIIETQRAKQALRDIEARHQDIMMLEKNILELHEMFQDLAELIEIQGEMVDNIEDNMVNTVENVEAGKTQTKQAVVNVKKVRKSLINFSKTLFKTKEKKKILIGVIIAAVIIIIVIIVVVVLAVKLK